METIGRYEIIRELGRGAMGVVYRARDPKIDREVAIKTIKLSDKADSSEVQGLRERLVREAQSAGKLSHPNIVTVYDVDEINDVAFIAMELVEGRTLEQDVKKGPITDYRRIADVLGQAAAALDYAHGKGIIHRDVKPGNLMLADDGTVKIMDFGIARIGSSNLTQTGSVLGTPSYMSPEQVKGEELDGRSDQFSLGVIAYEMLTGHKPFPGENLTAVIFKIVSKEPAPIADLKPGVPSEMAAVVMRALSKDRADRFVDCKAFADAFAGMSAGLAPAADFTEETREISAVQAPEPPLRPRLEPLRDETSKLPPLRRASRRTFQSEDPKKRWGSRVAAGLAAALLLLGVGFAAMNPRIFQDPKGGFQAAVSWLTGGGAPARETTQGRQATIGAYEAPPAMRPVAPAPPVQEEQAPEQETQEEEPPPAPQAEVAQPEAAKPEPPKPAPAKAAVAPKPPTFTSVSLNVRTTPPGARITVGDRPDWKCESPCSLAGLPPGSHAVQAEMEGFHTARRIVELGANRQESVQITLEDDRITAMITSEPTGGEIYIDGRKIPEKTNAKVLLRPGTYRIKVVKERVGEAEQVVVISKGQIPYTKFVLRKK